MDFKLKYDLMREACEIDGPDTRKVRRARHETACKPKRRDRGCCGKRTPSESVTRTNSLREQIQRANDSTLGRITELLPIWLPGGRREGQEYVCANLGGGQGRSCKVNLGSGKWADFATGDRGGQWSTCSSSRPAPFYGHDENWTT